MCIRDRSSLPLGENQIHITRGMTTSAVAIIVPFVTQELFQGGDSQMCIRDRYGKGRVQRPLTEGLPIGTYNIIYADPPWRYEQRKVQGAAENHYSTMSIDELCALPVPELAAKDCALFLWACLLYTSPIIGKAEQIVNRHLIQVCQLQQAAVVNFLVFVVVVFITAEG